MARGMVTLRDMQGADRDTRAADKNNNQREIPISDITTILKTEVQKNE